MPESDASIVTLVEAAISHRNDGELWGGIAIEWQSGETRLYAQFLPQSTEPDPPGWSAIADITGVTAEEVVGSWNDEGTRNEAAVKAFDQLHDEVGQQFLVRIVDGVEGKQAIDLTPLRGDAHDLTAVATSINRDLVEEVPTVEARYVPLLRLDPFIDQGEVEPPQIILTSDGAPPYSIQVPDMEHEADPVDWWFVEVLTGVPAGHVAVAWKREQNERINQLLSQAILTIAPILSGKWAPLTPAGTIDLDQFRRDLVRKRFLEQNIQPFLFGGRPVKLTCTRVWELLKDTIGPFLYRSSVIRGLSSGTPAVIRPVEGQAKLEVLDDDVKMRGILINAIDFASRGKGTSIRHTNPPAVITQNMITFADQTVPPIDTLARIPTMRRDGSIHDQEGYDRRARIWYAPELELEPIPEDPSDFDMRRALETILQPFKQFPFVDASGGLSATIACLLDQIVRPMIPGPRPIYAFDAPAFKGQGTGKTLLARSIGSIITGRDVEVTGWPDDPKEVPKIITTKLLQSDPFVIFDNLEGTVNHKDLSALATTPMWSSRLLHKNEAPKLPQTATWCLTLNGARFNRDIARRCVTIRIDAQMDDPSRRRGFDIPDLIPWCIEHRAQLIRSCLILSRSWVNAGKRPDTRIVMGSFEAWSRTVGGILSHAGLSDLPLAIHESRERDIDTNEHSDFVQRWQEVFPPPTAATAVQLAQIAEMHHLYASALEKRAPNWKGRYMTDILKKLEGHRFGNWYVHKLDKLWNGYAIYTLLDRPPTKLTLVQG